MRITCCGEQYTTPEMLDMLIQNPDATFEVSIRSGCLNFTHHLSYCGGYIFDRLGCSDYEEYESLIHVFAKHYRLTMWLIDDIEYN